MLVIPIKLLGWFLAMLPETFVRLLCQGIGDCIFLSKRGHVAIANLHHAFPDKPLSWHKKIAREHCRRMVELFAYAFCAPHFSEKRLDVCLEIADFSYRTTEQIEVDGGGVLLLPHMTMMESVAQMPRFFPDARVAGLYRPLDYKPLDDWVRESRSRYGIELLSRKSDLLRCSPYLKSGGWVGILFEQNAGRAGALITLFGRVASATDLPGILAQRSKSPVLMVCMRRSGFWRASAEIVKVDCELTPESVTVATNAWLENYLTESDDNLADWFWGHNRWFCQKNPRLRFRLEQKKNYLDACQRFHGYDALPRKTRFFFHLPPDPLDALHTIPCLRTMARTRPDADVTLLAPSALAPLLQEFPAIGHCLELPDDTRKHRAFFRGLKDRFPDTYTCLDTAIDGSPNARLMRCPQTLSAIRPGTNPRHYNRKTDRCWEIPANAPSVHRTDFWLEGFEFFGMNEAPDFSPLPIEGNEEASEHAGRSDQADRTDRTIPVGLVTVSPPAASEFTFTVEDLCLALSGLSVETITAPAFSVALADAITACRVIVCHDPATVLIANLLGVPVVALLSSSDAERHGPRYTTPSTVLPVTATANEIAKAIKAMTIGGSQEPQ